MTTTIERSRADPKIPPGLPTPGIENDLSRREFLAGGRGVISTLPEAFYLVAVQSVVAAEKRDAFGKALGDDEPVERVAVVEREPRDRVEVRGGDLHYLYAVGGSFLDGQIVEGEFELEFPGT